MKLDYFSNLTIREHKISCVVENYGSAENHTNFRESNVVLLPQRYRETD